MLQWFCSFITTRRQQAVINGYSSDCSTVISRVLQGSILGSLLFIQCISDSPSAVCSPMKIFADDVAMYCSAQSNTDCSTFQNDLDLIAAWCSKWQMHLILLKSELQCVFNKCLPVKSSYYINNHNLNGFHL